jgi:aminoglycoside phosphotransferase (APT) family kinase protein
VTVVTAHHPAARALETAVTGLRHALDAEGMRMRLERLLWPEGGGSLEQVAVGKLLYRPDGTCSVRYTAAVRRPGGGRRQVTVAGRVLADARAAEAFLRDLEPIERTAAGHPLLRGVAAAVAADPAVPMAVHVFPIEPELPGLPAATDPARAGELLRAVLGRAGAGPCRVEVADHPREGRCTLRYRPAAGEIVYAKVARGVSPEPAAAMRAVRDAARGLRVPRPLGTMPELGLSLQAEVAGTPCVNALLRAASTGQQAAALDACGRAAALMHGCPAATARIRGAESDAAGLRRDVELVRRIDPELAGDLAACIERALEAAGPTGHGLARLCHGDLTHRQFVIDHGIPGLLDFDDVCMAEPALDLGRFCAYLRLAVRRAAGEGDDDGEAMCRRFLRAYAAEAGAGPLERRCLARRVTVHEALALVHVAISSWRQGKSSRLARVRSLLEEGNTWPRA